MAQTEREFSIIESLLGNNTTGDISPQDLRDAFASMMGYAGIVLSVSGAPKTIVGVGTSYSLVDIFDTITAQSSTVNSGGSTATLSPDYCLTMPTAGIYRVDFWASFSSGSGNELVTFRPHVNGNPGIVEVDRDVSANDTGSVSFSGIIPYSAGDVIDVRVKIDSGTDTLTFLSAGLSTFRVG